MANETTMVPTKEQRAILKATLHNLMPTDLRLYLREYINALEHVESALEKVKLGRDELISERNKYQQFKDFVHAYLDQHSVPHGDPENQHQKEGCRIGARLDLLLKDRDAWKSKAETSYEAYYNDVSKYRETIDALRAQLASLKASTAGQGEGMRDGVAEEFSRRLANYRKWDNELPSPQGRYGAAYLTDSRRAAMMDLGDFAVEYGDTISDRLRLALSRDGGSGKDEVKKLYDRWNDAIRAMNTEIASGNFGPESVAAYQMQLISGDARALLFRQYEAILSPTPRDPAQGQTPENKP